VHADEQRSLELSDEGITIRMLTPTGQNAMMPVINVYRAGGGMAESARHDGEEFVHVLEGTLEFTFGDASPVLLKAGDTAYYRADVPHSFRNVGEHEARFLGVTTPPNL
jgi:quercetin dioxygenase-like cupin family protein